MRKRLSRLVESKCGERERERERERALGSKLYKVDDKVKLSVV